MFKKKNTSHIMYKSKIITMFVSKLYHVDHINTINTYRILNYYVTYNILHIKKRQYSKRCGGT